MRPFHTFAEACRIEARATGDPQMILTVAVDPGKRKAGLAIAQGNTLIFTDTVMVRRPQGPTRLAEKCALVIRGFVYPRIHTLRIVQEIPRDYPGKQGRTVDLNALREMNDALWEECRALTRRRRDEPALSHLLRRFRPSEWKGGVPKSVHHPRVRAALSVREALLWPDGHDARDAVGLLLFDLGRIGRGGMRGG